MKVEYLILIENNDTFCNSKKAFIEFLKVDSLISVSGQKLSYRKSQKTKIVIESKFRIETDVIPSKKERYFLVVIENNDNNLIDEFSELCDKIKQISKRINPESIVINTLWDDIGRHYAYLSYPLINEVENLMRKLISKFMLINVGMHWSKETIHQDLFKKIEDYEEEDLNLNDLYKLDFIHLSQVLFQKKRDISLEELDRLLSKTQFSDNDKKAILKYIPTSNWDKYFSNLLNQNEKSLETKWEILYKLRNKVAHNRFITKDSYKKIEGLTKDIKNILINAINKLGEVNLDEEDRELLLYSYHQETPQALGFLAEQLVAEFYLKKGYKVNISHRNNSRQGYQPDLIIEKLDKTTIVEIKSMPIRMVNHILNRTIDHTTIYMDDLIKKNKKVNGRIILVLRDYDSTRISDRLKERINLIRAKINKKIKIKFGFINKYNEFEPLKL